MEAVARMLHRCCSTSMAYWMRGSVRQGQRLTKRRKPRQQTAYPLLLLQMSNKNTQSFEVPLMFQLRRRCSVDARVHSEKPPFCALPSSSSGSTLDSIWPTCHKLWPVLPRNAETSQVVTRMFLDLFAISLIQIHQ